MFDAEGKLLFENTWSSYYVGEPIRVRVGTRPQPKPLPKGPVAPLPVGEALVTPVEPVLPPSDAESLSEPTPRT